MSDMRLFGEFIWEATKKFDFVKITSASSVLSKGTTTIQFTIMKANKTFSHTEVLTLDMIQERMFDPRTVVDAIYQQCLTNASKELNR